MTNEFFATSPKHTESLLADELSRLGALSVTEARSGVRFVSELALAYRVCLWSRVANRVLKVLSRFAAVTPEALYAGVQQIDWAEHLEPSQTLAVDFHGTHSALAHSQFGAQKVKDAIVDQFRQATGQRPSVQLEQPDLRVNVHLLRDEATLSLDLSGDSLHRRGYRTQGVAAPLKENLAAVILLRAGWPQIAAADGVLVDPMCGSGTLPIEAAMMAADIAPGLQRRYWGFLGWKGHDRDAWHTLLEEAQRRKARGLLQLTSLRGYDQDPAAIRVALANIEAAGLVGRVHIERVALEDCGPGRRDDWGLVVINPPYGERIGGQSQLPALYARLGDVLKERFRGWRAVVFTGNPELGKQLGLRAKRSHSLYNGAIPCKLLHFEVTPEWFLSRHPRPRALPAEARSDAAQMFANRVQKNRKHLGRWLKRHNISCYRLYDADLPEYAVAIDVYEGDKCWVHIQEYEAPKSIDERKARLRVREALGVVQEVLGVPEDRLFFKIRRQQKGKAQYEKLATTEHFHEVRENGCRFLVNFEDYLDTGLFLDQRITRGLLAELAGDRHFLNLFAYTGTASVYAAVGGAASTTTVDLSKTYLDWARRNLTLNGLTGPQHALVQADCLAWLDQSKGHRKYGLIFLDPPSFSASKRMQSTFDVQRDHVVLIRKTVKLLEEDGVLIFSNNLRRFRMDHEALADLIVEEITPSTIPKDFERNPRVHNCWKIRRAS